MLRPLVALAISALAVTAQGGPLPPEKVPAPLRPWTEWALHGAEEAFCPFFQGREAASCAWPSHLDLAVQQRGATFRQEWRAYAEVWVALPGDGKRWPLDVRVDGAPAPVSGEEGPRIRLMPGAHVVTGSFAWDAPPDSLVVPAETGLLALTVHGARVDLPIRDDDGRVFFQREAAGGRVEDRIEVTAHRKLTDAVPLELETFVELRVSGKNREVSLQGAVPAGFTPMALRSPLPAQLDRKAGLRVQVRPGTWSLHVLSRRETPAESVALPAAIAPWPAEEVWVFEARPALRTVQVEGVPAVDPAQTTLPSDWRRLPAYRVGAGEAMRLVEQRRGDADPGPDELTLRRALWLDFDGGGYTVRDDIKGTLARASRLDALPETRLGHVTVDGQDQLITWRDAGRGGERAAGVELRGRAVSLRAESRVPGRRGDIPAVGWDTDVHAASATLNLPPGWRLFHASGADEVDGTWIRHWTLLDLFLALVIALAFARLWGRGAGALALATMALLFPEPAAPRWVWLAVLAAEALVRVVPAGRWLSLLRAARVAAWAALVLAALPFAVSQLRAGLHPALERAGGEYDLDSFAATYAPASPPMQAFKAASAPDEDSSDEEPPARAEAVDGWAGGPPAPAPVERRAKAKAGPGAVSAPLSLGSAPQRARLQQIDPTARVQTGPGVPRWQWRSLALRWSGPVERTQRLRLWLLPPRANLILAVARVALLALLAARAVGRPRVRPAGAALAAALLVLTSTPAAARADDLPGDQLLQALRERLIEKPACAPRCASAARLLLEIGPATLRARLELGAAARTAVPLPGNVREWAPRTVLVDGRPAQALQRDGDGTLWAALEPGTHQLLLEGPLPPRETVQIALPLRPHRVEARVAGWRLEGVHEDGLTGDGLQLTRLHTAGEVAAGALQQGALPPFLRVERELLLGLTWEVETTVVRTTPAGTAVMLAVPLLPGESVTTDGVRVEAGKVLLNLAPGQSRISWRSALEPRGELALSAPRGVEWVEAWRLVASPIWHVAPSGIPATQSPASSEPSLLWRPWPGETLTLAITRPEAVPGQTLTIDRSTLSLSPGARANDARMTLTVRSSRGGQHTITLPEGAQLQHLAVNDQQQPARQDGRKVTFPVVPGAQEVKLTWREGRGLGLRFVGSEVDLGGPSANAHVNITPGEGRWTLFVGGPRLGPAVLFWSLLAVLLLAAVGLSRLRITPLGIGAWLLLGVGLATLPPWAAAIVAGWLLVLGWRARTPELARWPFALRQILLVLWTAAALASLLWAIQNGLLGAPDMQIRGNESTAELLRWFQDRVDGPLPRPWVITAPMGVYRAAMLLWALWLAWSLLGWLRWAWGSFTTGGGWKRLRKVKEVAAAPEAAAEKPEAELRRDDPAATPEG